MAVSTGKKVAFAVILIAAYFIGKGNEDHQKYDDLKNKPQSDLTQEDRDFIKKTEDERAQAEVDRKNYLLEEAKSKEASKPKPLSEQELLQNDVIFTCRDIARGLLNSPDSFEIEQAESGVDEQESKKVYYYTLHYSGVNAFNVRSTHTIECYGTLGDKSHNVTYKKFN